MRRQLLARAPGLAVATGMMAAASTVVAGFDVGLGLVGLGLGLATVGYLYCSSYDYYTYYGYGYSDQGYVFGW